MSKKWLQVHQPCQADQVPEVESHLLAAGAVSVTYTDSEDQPLYEPAPGETPIWDKVTVVALFPGETEDENLESGIAEKLASLHLAPCSWSLLEDQEWERAWLKDFKPVCFGDKLWVCPAGMTPETQKGVILKLDPGLAFGTGSHPTTSLCLQWLATQEMNHKSLVDYGCGSGILGIAALLLGADIVHGIDNDPQALVASRDNAAKNAIPLERIPLYMPGDFARRLAEGQITKVDMVLANILAGPLMSLAQYLSAMVKTGGYILLSGILEEQADAVMATFSEWFDFDEPAIQEEWCRLSGLRK